MKVTFFVDSTATVGKEIYNPHSVEYAFTYILKRRAEHEANAQYLSAHLQSISITRMILLELR